MNDIDKKELKTFIKSRAFEDLRKFQRKQVIAIQVFSSLIIFLLGATIWHIIIFMWIGTSGARMTRKKLIL